MHRRDKIPTTVFVYEDNYGYRRNTNQPMKDYVDANRRGENPQYPHLPWSNERLPKPDWSSNKVPDYTRSDAKSYSNGKFDCTNRSERYTDDDKVIKRTSKRASGSQSYGNVHLQSTEEKLIRKLQDREDKRRVQSIMDDIERMKVRFNADRDVQLSSKLKSSIRGKSASQITAALLEDSEKNIHQSKNNEQIQMHCSRQSRGISESRVVKRTTHIEFVDDHMLDQLDQSMSSSLYDVKKQLKNFNQRAEDLYQNSRWCKSYFQ